MMNPADDSFVVSIGGKPPTRLGGDPVSKKWPTMKEILNQQGPFLPLWHKIFLISCVIAVSIDPLFFYIPIIDEDKKCLRVDRNLRAAALTLRTLTDTTFLIHIFCQIRSGIQIVNSEGKSDWKSKVCASAQKSWRSILIDILAVLPIPQVLLVYVFFEMKSSGYLEKRKLLNVFLLSQYLPRLYRIHISSKNLRRTGKWTQCMFNILLYVLASHLLGAFWYYFSVQRETSCWHRACKSTGCISNFYCHDHNSTNNITLLKTNCPMDVPANTTAPFDFGIFLDSLKSGIPVSRDFPQKLFYCFWWGLRNLSNFGTNLETSPYVWENCFAILISGIGLLLFLYLLGNVQTLIQMTTAKSEEIRQKIKMKEKEIEAWMDGNGLPDDMKSEIKKNIEQTLEENKDADLQDIFSILPWQTKKSIKRFLFMNTLRKVPMLQNMDAKVLKLICDYLKPVKYAQNKMIVQMGDPLDHMLFITDGLIWTYKTCSSNSSGRSSSKSAKASSMVTFQKGEFYGEELLARASLNKSFEELPLSTKNVKCHTQVEGFVLMAKDLRSVVTKTEFLWNSQPVTRVQVAW